jgi:hypothetical protein
MERLSKILQTFIISALVAVILLIYSIQARRHETAKHNIVLQQLFQSFSVRYPQLALSRANHMTWHPRIVASTIPRREEIPQPFQETYDGVCTSNWRASYAGNDMFDCVVVLNTEMPRSVLAYATVTYDPEQMTSTSEFARETASLRT